MPKGKAGDLYIASVIHVQRDGKNEKGEKVKVTETIQPGQMVSDTDLTDEEVKDLLRHKGVLRAATLEEQQLMDSRDERKAAAESVQETEQERERLANEQQIEKDRIDAEARAEADEKKRKLEEKQAKERDALAAKASKASGAKK